MRLEKFEQEYQDEISKMQMLRFNTTTTPEFKIPAYKFIYTKALSLAFAIPAFAIMFGLFFYANDNQTINKDLAQLEASNTRILNQINTLDYENNI